MDEPRSLQRLLATGECNGIQYDDRLRAAQWQRAARWLGRIIVLEDATVRAQGGDDGER